MRVQPKSGILIPKPNGASTRYHAGRCYDVPDDLGADWIESGAALELDGDNVPVYVPEPEPEVEPEALQDPDAEGCSVSDPDPVGYDAPEVPDPPEE